MSQTVTASKIGVVTTEAAQNAAIHGPHDRSSIKGVTSAEATSNAVTNSQTAAE